MQATLQIGPEELASWVRDARRGDREAFERILTAHERTVLRVALRMLGRMEDAQEASQEVFLKLHRSLDRFEERCSFGAWLYRMTVNVCLDMIRARRRHLPLDFDRPSPAVAEQSLLLEERKRAVAEAMRELPEKERAALVLRDMEGLPTSEVAELLGVTEATVRSQIYQARIKLRRLIAGRNLL